MSVLCQKRTHAPQQNVSLFDQLVGALLERERHIETECLCGLEVDHQLELDRGLDGKVAWLLALEDVIGIARRAPIIIEQVTSVGQEAAEFSEETVRIDGREAVASRQRRDLNAMDVHEAIRHHDQATIGLVCLYGNDGFELGGVANRYYHHLHGKGRSGGFEGVQERLGVW